MKIVFGEASVITQTFGSPPVNRTTPARYRSLGLRPSRGFLEASLCVSYSPQKTQTLFGITKGLDFGC